MGYSFRLTTKVILYALCHRQDNTYHILCYTSRGTLAGTRNSLIIIRRNKPYITMPRGLLLCVVTVQTRSALYARCYRCDKYIILYYNLHIFVSNKTELIVLESNTKLWIYIYIHTHKHKRVCVCVCYVLALPL